MLSGWLAMVDRESPEKIMQNLECINLRKRLFTGTVPANKNYVTGTVPANKTYVTGTVEKKKTMFPGSVPVSGPQEEKQCY